MAKWVLTALGAVGVYEAVAVWTPLPTITELTVRHVPEPVFWVALGSLVGLTVDHFWRAYRR